MDPPRSDGSTSPGSSKSGASVPEEIEMKDMTTSGGGQSSGGGTAAGTSTGGVSSQAGGPVVRSSSTTPSGSSSSPRKSATSGQRPTGGEEIELSAVSVTTSDRTSGSADSQSANGRIGPNPFAVAHAWWQYRTLKQKLIFVLKLVGIILVVVLLVGLLLSIRFKGPSTSTTTHPFANESNSGLPSEWAPVSPVESSTADYGDGSEAESSDLPITAMPTEPTAAVDEEATSASSHSAEPPIPGASQGTEDEEPTSGSTHGTEAPIPGSTHGTEEPTPGSNHGTEAPIPDSTYGTEEPTPGPTHGTKAPTRGFTEGTTKSSTPGFTRGTEAPTQGSSRDIEPPTPGLTQGTEASTPGSTVSTKSPDRLNYESQLNSIINHRVDPCDNFYSFVCGNWKDEVSIEMATYNMMLKVLEPAMEDERNHRHNVTRKPYPMAVTIVVDLYFECLDSPPRSQPASCLANIFEHHSFVCTRLYVDYRTHGINSAAFLHQNREIAARLFLFMRASFKEDVEKYINWMDDKTRKNTLEKLNRLGLGLGFFPRIFDNEFLNYVYNIKNNSYPSHYLRRTMTFREKAHELRITKVTVLVGALDRASPYYDWLHEIWDNFMGISSALYSSDSNMLFMQIHWLDKPLFGTRFPAFFNFAAFGSVMGHEITHGFDINDSEDFITNVTRARFEEQTKCFVEQYNNLPVLGWDAEFDDDYRNYKNATVNGQKTANENVADAGGLKIAYYAYRRFLKNGGIADIPLLHSPARNFTDYQMFFIYNAFAQCEAPVNNSNYLSKVRYGYDSHSPPWHRVNMPMCNFDRFSEAFNCPATSRMNCQQKCVIW